MPLKARLDICLIILYFLLLLSETRVPSPRCWGREPNVEGSGARRNVGIFFFLPAIIFLLSIQA